MLKKKVLSVLLACTLCLSALCVGASAVSNTTAKYKGTDTLISGDGYDYIAWCTLYVSNTFTASVEIRKYGTILDPPNGLSYMAYLYDGNGKVRSTGSAEAITYQDYFPLAVTGNWSGESAFAGGAVWLKTTYAGTKKVVVNPTGTYQLGRSMSGIDSVLEELSLLLDENGQYPVNVHGETYGSGLLYEIVGEEPDLIEAVGTDGTEGYVRTEELHPFYDVEEGEDILIPLYNVNSEEIGSFKLELAGSSVEEVQQ